MEIDLLKNLNVGGRRDCALLTLASQHCQIYRIHENQGAFVHYFRVSSDRSGRGFANRRFCENGSLHTISRRYGKFPENLVAVYIAQVLEGLWYLHEQGVIHRDIKGANILTTKDGSVKLADFGVATKTSSLTDAAVVGSPYWMAPEIIELSGATTASDIWSVGCVVIELLAGNPPYHYLDAMPALFRIVQDDHPPIPEGSSPIVKDFLMQCFQKDANLRVSARKLLKHPWIANVKRHQSRENPSNRSVTRYDNAVKTVQEWNEALRVAPNSSTIKFVPKASPAGPRVMSSKNNSLQAPAIAAKPKTSPRAPRVVSEDKDEDWEGDFENLDELSNSTMRQGTKLFDMSSLSKTPKKTSITPTPKEKTGGSSKLERFFDEDNQKTIRPFKPKIKKPLAERKETTKSPKSMRTRPSIVEDYSDILGDHEDLAKITFKRASKENSQFPEIYHPSDLKALGATLPYPSTQEPPPPSPLNRSMSARNLGNLEKQRAERPKRQPSEVHMTTYKEPEVEDYGDLFGNITPDEAADLNSEGSLKLNTKLSGNSWLGDEHSDEDDPFADIDEGYDETDLETNLARDKYARLCATVDEKFGMLQVESPESKVLEACDALLDILTETPEMKMHLTSSHGVLPIVEKLEDCDSREISSRLLQIVNILMLDNVEMQENLCLVGGIPVIMAYASKRYPEEIRMGAAAFLREMCHTSTLTLQMFISCRGPKVLVELLDEEYSEQKALIWMAINGIWNVFTLQSPTTKSEFCRIFLKKGLLDPLSMTLLHVLRDKDPQAKVCLEKVVTIILFLSQADAYVKDLISTRSFVKQLLHEMDKLPPALLVTTLKAIRNLSTNPNSLDVLQNADAIDILSKILANRKGPEANDVASHSLTSLYNLCRINKSRQEEAVQAGLVPHLQYFVRINSPLKQFALPILCDIPHASKQCRKALWQYEGLKFYLDLLSDPYWQVNALEALLVWLQDETAKVEAYLTANANAVGAILKAFITAKANSFEHFLDPLYKVFRLSKDLVIAIAQPDFFQRLLDRLGHHKAIVRLSLLRLLKCICEVHPLREALIEQYALRTTIQKIREQDGAVLVKELAKEMLSQKAFSASRRTVQA